MKKLLFLLLFPIVSFAQVRDSTTTSDITTLSNMSSTYTNEKSKIITVLNDLNSAKRARFGYYPTSGTNSYTVNVPWFTAYTANVEVPLYVGNVNSGASTINITGLGGSPLGVKTITSRTRSALVGGELKGYLTLIYDGTNFQVRGDGGSGGATWGSITGTLSSQTDLNSALSGKQSTITFGTGVQTALGVNIGSAGAPVLFNGAGGTPSSLSLSNATGLPISTGMSGLGSNVANFLATPSGSNFASALTSAVPASVGGTGLTSYTTGDIPYASGSTTISKLGIGSSGQVLTVSGGLPTWQSSSPTYPSANTQTVDYTTVLGDAGGIIYMDNSSALNITIPPNASVAYATGTIIYIQRINTGTLTVVAGSGVTINTTSGTLTDPGQYVTMTLVKTGTNIWTLQNGSPFSVTDWSSSVTTTGWSSFTIKTFHYWTLGKLVYCTISFAGTSNATTTTFSIPFTPNVSQRISIIADDNGSGVNGRINIASGSTTVNAYASAIAGAWTASGNKIITLSFFYESQ